MSEAGAAPGAGTALLDAEAAIVLHGMSKAQVDSLIAVSMGKDDGRLAPIMRRTLARKKLIARAIPPTPPSPTGGRYTSAPKGCHVATKLGLAVIHAYTDWRSQQSRLVIAP